MDKRAIQLADLLEIKQLQEMQDSCANITGLTIVLLDPGGYSIIKPSNSRGFYGFLHSNSQYFKLLLGLHRRLCGEHLESGKTARLRCPYSGQMLASVPIFYQGEYLASWLIGHTQVEPTAPDVFHHAAEVTGMQLSELEAIAALSPTDTQLHYNTVITFIEKLTSSMINLAGVGYTMVQNNQNLVEITEQLDSTAQMLTKFTNSADVGMFVTDFFTGEILQANEYFARVVGKTVGEMIGNPCWNAFYPGQDMFCAHCPHHQLLDERGHPGKPIVLERQFSVDQQIWMRYTHQAIYWVDGRLAHMVTFIDITSIIKMQQQLERLAFYDRDLQLPNALKLEQDLQTMSSEEKQNICIICFDIVSFRTINDVYSRNTGDALLKEITNWALDIWETHCGLYRVEGDEFALCVRAQDTAMVMELAQKIEGRFEEPWVFQVDGEMIHIFCNISIGVINLKDRLSDNEEILSIIERTLSSVRKDGGIVVYDEAMDQQYKEHLRLELSLKSCVKDGMRGFSVYYQPIVDTITGAWCSLEALCRWESPECGMVSPIVFIHEAEQLGLIGTIGRWVLEQALSQCKKWGLDKLDQFILDVNLSPAQITDDSLVNIIVDLLEEYDFPGEKLSLEITESTEMNFTNHTMSAIERLRNAKVIMALDDFGTGYSSFNNLKNLPVSILKTERAFIENIENESYLQYLFYVMVQLAHAADMKIIAEGVETEEQLRIVLNNGVDFLQGYYFSKPLSAQDMESQLHKFSNATHIVQTIANERICTGQITDTENRITISPTLYKLLISCMQILLSPIQTDDAVHRTLAMVGEKFEVSRVYVFWRKLNGRYSSTHEWCAPSIQSQKDFLANLYLPDFYASWVPLLEQDNIILASDVNNLPEDICRVMQMQDIKATLVIPVWNGGVLAGFVGFDDCVNNRSWTPEEVIMLRNLCMLISNVVARVELQNQVERQETLMRSVLNSMNTPIYVSDPDSHEIVFANNYITNTFGQVEGKKCYQVLQSKEAPCDFCKVPWLRENPSATQCSWEFYNKVSERHYKIYDTFVSWVEGRQMHLEYAFDITQLKNYRDKLEVYTSTDIFTNTHNRGTLLTQLRESLRDTAASRQRLAICMVQLHELKYFNENFGYAEGDKLILNTVAKLKEYIGDRDLIGRYNGDEFVIGLHGCTVEQAREKVEKALEKLDKENQDAPHPYSFRYGLVASGELTYEEGIPHLKRLLEIARQRIVVQE